MISIIKNNIRQLLLCFLLPLFRFKYKKTILFLSHPDMCDNSFALFQFLNERLSDEWHFFWIVADKDVASLTLVNEVFSSDTGRIHILSQKSLSSKFISKLCNYQFDTSGNEYKKYRCVKSITTSLWHGSPLKAIGNSVLPGGYKLHPEFLCSAHSVFNRFLSDGLNTPSENIIITGYPRNDWLTGNLKSKNPIDINGCFVVWMPTYTRSSGLVYKKTYYGNDSNVGQDSLGCVKFSDLVRLDTYLSELKIKLVIKLHSHDDRNVVTFDKLTNVIFLRGDDLRIFGSGLYGLLFRSSALISDCSSVVFDYALTEKPIAIDMTSLERYTRPLNFPFPAEDDDDLYQVYTYEDICSFLVQVKKGARSTCKMNHKFNLLIHGLFSESVAKKVGLIDDSTKSNGVAGPCC